MAVNLHDSAYELEKAIRNSDEYVTLRKLYDEVNADASAKEMFEKFRNMQMELQQKQMMGQEIPTRRDCSGADSCCGCTEKRKNF